MFVQARKPKYQKKEPRKTRKRSSPQRPVIPDLTPPPQRIPVVSRPVTKRSVRIPGRRASDDQDHFRNPITDQSIIFPLPQELQYLSKVNNSSSSLSSFYSSSSEDEPILTSPNSDSKPLAPIQLSVIKKIVKPALEPPPDSSADSACDSDAGKGRGGGDAGAGVRKVILGQR